MPRAPSARSRPVAMMALLCASSVAVPIYASTAAPTNVRAAPIDTSDTASIDANAVASIDVGPLPQPLPALRDARIDRAAVLHDERFVLRASAVPRTSPDAQHGSAGLALRAATLSAKGADPCGGGAIFKDGFEEP